MTTQLTLPFSTPSASDVRVGFSRWDIAVAKVMVRRLIEAGARKGPSDLLLIEGWMYDRWLEEDAVAFLRQMAEGAKLQEMMQVQST